MPLRQKEIDMQVNMTVNDEAVTAEVEARVLLVHFLRDHLGLTGTHWGCDTSNCGTCVVEVDGEPDPTEDEIREAISGQICRCTGYTTIVRSVQWAARNAHEEANA